MQNALEKAVPAQDPTTGSQDTYESVRKLDIQYIFLPTDLPSLPPSFTSFCITEAVTFDLRHPDMPGERVTFEIGYEGRRMVARTVFRQSSSRGFS